VDAIALFGSALSGITDKDSDIDLIIISSDFKDLDIIERSKMTMKPETDTLRKFKVLLDVINLSLDKYNESKIRYFYQSKIVA